MGLRASTTVSLGHFRLAADGDITLKPGLELGLRLGYLQGGTRDGDRIEVASDFFYVRREMSFQGVEALAEVRWQLLPSLHLTAGAELLYDNVDLPPPSRVSKLSDEVVPMAGGDSEHQLLNPGLFAQGRWNAVERYLTLTAGLRYDFHNIYGNQLSGRVGAGSLLSDDWAAKLLYGTAVKAPSPLLLYAVPLRPGDTIGNADLEPQRIHTFEAQTSYRLSRYVRLTVDGAYSILLDGALFVPRGVNQAAENIARVNTLSVEASLQAAYRDVASGYLSVERQHAVRDLGGVGYQAELIGERLVGYPEYLVRVGATGLSPLSWLPLRASAQAIWVARRRAFDSNLFAAGRDYSLPAYVLLNGSLSLDTWRPLKERETTLALRGYNLLGVQGPDPGFAGIDYPLSGREILLELRQEF